MARIFIQDLRLDATIGIHDWEQKTRQRVVINVVLQVDTRRAAQTDDVADTCDYRALAKRTIELVETGRFGLLERLAHEILQLAHADARVQHAVVRVDKPGAVRRCDSVAVEVDSSNLR